MPYEQLLQEIATFLVSAGTASFVVNLSSSFVIGNFPLKKTPKSWRREFPIGREGGTLARLHEIKRSRTACSLVSPARWCKSFTWAGSKATLKRNASVYRAHRELHLSQWALQITLLSKLPMPRLYLTKSGRSWREGVSHPSQGSAWPGMQDVTRLQDDLLGSALCSLRNGPALQHEL